MVSKNNKTTSGNYTKKIVTISMLCAVAYTVTVVFRIPIVPAATFLKFDMKDVVLVMGGFLYGPAYAFLMSVVVSLLEMFSVSQEGMWGCAANILSSSSLICTAGFIYQKRKTLGGAIIGLITGVILMAGVMALWNYLAVPIYKGFPQKAVAEMLLPVFIPFNLFKGGVNSVITMLLFKPLVTALYRADLIEPPIIGRRSTVMKWIFIGAGVITAAVILIVVLKFEPSILKNTGS